MALLDDAKVFLRLSNVAFDIEVTSLIEDAKADLLEANLKISKMTAFEANPDDEPLIKMAVMFYCKANFGYNNKDRKGLQESYEMRKEKLLLITDYQEVE